MKRINTFFWFCSGAHLDTLAKTPTEHQKYVGIGATIFFTGLFASIAGAYALYFVFSGTAFALSIALLFGLVWGCAIFNMDRYIVSTINKKATAFKQFLQALPRLLLALLIGIVISRPLEIKVFDKEIKEQLKLNYLAIQRAKIDTLNNTFNSKYAAEISKHTSLTAERNALIAHLEKERQSLNHEIFGNKTLETSGIMGYGPYAKRKEEALRNGEEIVQRLTERIVAQENLLSKKRDYDGVFGERLLTTKQLDSLADFAGFADRNAALGQLRYDKDGKINESNYWAILFVTLLFVFFECLPVLVKLMSAKGPYDDLVNDEEELASYRSAKEKEVSMAAIDMVQEDTVSIKKAQLLQKISKGVMT